MMKPKALMTLFTEGSLVTPELREFLNDDAAMDRFERQNGCAPNGPDFYCGVMHEIMEREGAI